MTKKVTLVLSNAQARQLEREFSDSLEEQKHTLERRDTAELAQAFENKYSDTSLSEKIGLLLADEYDLDYDV